MAVTLKIQQDEYSDGEWVGSVDGGDWGCGKELKWSKMQSLTQEELQTYGLVPKVEGTCVVEPCASNVDMQMEQFLAFCGCSFGQYQQAFEDNFGPDCTIRNLVELPESQREECIKFIVPESPMRLVHAQRIAMVLKGLY
jgi:hypothetical protein